MSELSLELAELVAASKRACLPTEADSVRVLAALRLRLGDAAVKGAVTVHSAAVSNTAGLLFGKLSAIDFVGLVLLGGLLFFAARAQRAAASESNAAPRVAATIKADTALAVSAPAPSVTTPLEAGEFADAPRPTPDDVEARPDPTRDRLEEEVALLSRAETALHSGNAAVALAVLNEHERKFRHGQLVEERIAARIQALCKLGRPAEADAELAQLSPKSPYGRLSRRACASR